MSRILFSIDPGNKGCLAVFQGETPKLYTAPDLPQLLIQMVGKLSAAGRLSDLTVVIESPPLIPFMNLKGLHSQLTGYGRFLGIFQALNVSYITVLPKTWQSVSLPGRPTKKLGEKPHQFKARAKAFCIAAMQARFPASGVVTDGHADSLAIGLWGLKHLG